jgi:hypothetical protein
MPRSSRYNKGQWMLISAVIVTGTFLSISLVLKDYFIVDASTSARDLESQHFQNIKEQFENVVQGSSCTGTEMEDNLNDYIAFVRNSLQESGYLVYIEYEKTSGKTKNSYAYDCVEEDPNTPGDQRVRTVEKGIVIASEGIVYYSNMNSVDVKKVLPGFA